MRGHYPLAFWSALAAASALEDREAKYRFEKGAPDGIPVWGAACLRRSVGHTQSRGKTSNRLTARFNTYTPIVTNRFRMCKTCVTLM
jgi:hypothetical protein